VLVIPRRVVKRFLDLTKDEIDDLFLSSQQICGKLQEYFRATAVSLAIQVGCYYIEFNKS